MTCVVGDVLLNLPLSRAFVFLVVSFFFFFFFLAFLGPHLWHMEVPGPGIQSELQLPAYTTATALPDLSHICDLHYSSWQHQTLNPLSEARIKPTTSRFLVGFVSAAPQWELLDAKC